MKSFRYWILGLMWLSLTIGMNYIFISNETGHISIAAGKGNSASFEIATAAVAEFSKQFPKIEFEVYETLGELDSAQLLENGDVDLAVIGSNYEIKPDVESENVRSIARLFTQVGGLIVSESAIIDTYSDLAGKKVSISTGDQQSYIFLVVLMLYYGIDPSQYTIIPLSDDAANFAIQEGGIDAIYRTRNAADDSFRSIFKNSPNARFIPNYIGDALNLKYPFVKSVKIPSHAFSGTPAIPPTAVESAGMDTLLAANKSLPESLVYKLTKVLLENRSTLIVKSAQGGSIAPIDDNAPYTIPMHNGARQYYDREKPSLLQQNSRLLGSLIYLLAFLASCIVAIRTHFKRTHRMHMNEYNTSIIDIVDNAESSAVPADIQTLRAKLSSILKEVVKELDGDKISQTEFDRFSFTWRAAERMLERCEAKLERSESSKGEEDL